jgi:hypothetical protein
MTHIAEALERQSAKNIAFGRTCRKIVRSAKTLDDCVSTVNLKADQSGVMHPKIETITRWF